MNNNCKNCKHSIFDPLWGEYKCVYHASIMYILLDEQDCPNYEKKLEKEKEKNDEAL